MLTATSRPHAAAAGPQRPPGARTLYLAHGERKRVGLSDQSLVIANVLAQNRRYPLQRIARIVSSSTVDWSGAALQACQREAISITWMDPQGNALGTLYPQRGRSCGVGAALDLMFERPEGLQRYRHWQRSRRLDVLEHWRESSGQCIDPRAWEQRKREWVYAGNFAALLPAELRGHCLALVANQLAAEHMPPVCYGPESQAIELDEDLCELLWGEMNLGCGAIAAPAHDQATTTVLFERWQQRNAAALLVHIRSLNRLAHKAMRPDPVQ